MATKHTPGPWRRKPGTTGAPIIMGAGHEVAQVRYWRGSEDVAEVEANANLIEAAPLMLATLKDVFDFLQHSGYDTQLVKDAIDCAEGVCTLADRWQRAANELHSA